MEDMHTTSADTTDLLQNEEVIYLATQIFDALSDYTRFQILTALAKEECRVADLETLCHVSQSAISHQLRLLRDRKLVSVRKQGQFSFYRLADEHVRDLLTIGILHAAELEGVEHA